jgi:hypothetical protein
MSDEVEAIREALDNSDIDMLEKCFTSNNDKQEFFTMPVSF